MSKVESQMNEKWVHAPISKIVEALINREEPIIDYYFGMAVINEDKLTEALASLESSEREVLTKKEAEGIMAMYNSMVEEKRQMKEKIDFGVKSWSRLSKMFDEINDRYLAEKGGDNE